MYLYGASGHGMVIKEILHASTYLCQTPLCNFSGNLYSTDIILIQKITEMQAHR